MADDIEEKRKKDLGAPDGFERRNRLDRGRDGAYSLLERTFEDPHKRQLAAIEQMLNDFGNAMRDAGVRVHTGQMSLKSLSDLQILHINRLKQFISEQMALPKEEAR